LEQGSLRNDKETIAKVLPEVMVPDVDLSKAVVDQQNNVDTRTSEEKEMDAFLVVKESILACKVFSLQETSVGTSPVKSSMANEQVL